MFKLSKLFSWVKSHSISIIVIASIVITVVGGIGVWQAKHWEKVALRLEGKLEEQVADQNLLYAEAEKKDEARAVAELAEKKKRDDLEARIQKFQKDTVAGKRALRKEKEKTATLPPTELVTQINERIGEESALTSVGLFLFTRIGTTRTLDKFKDGEFYLSEYNKFEGVIADHETEVKSFNESIASCEEAVIDNLMGWEDCREVLATAQTSIVAEKKKGKASV
ncbi:hypothetical protein LCGC14_2573220, partial [marine sediment metagenome]